MAHDINNPSAVEQLAELGFQRASNDRVWDHVTDVYNAIHHYQLVPASLLPFMRDDTLCANVEAKGEHPQLMKLSRRLVEDVRTFNAKLVSIHNRHAGKTGSSKDPDDLMASIIISNDYVAYMDEYERIVMPTIEEMLEIFERAGLDTRSIRADAQNGAVYNVINTPSA